MLRVGLTGSIAVGKSGVLSEFRALGCLTIDADQVAHEVIMPPSRAYHQIVDAFGREVLDRSGEIDRARLGARVFDDREKLTRLNAIVHPRVREAIERRLHDLAASHPDRITVIDGALIIEAGHRHDYDRLVVVFCDPEEQLRRVMARGSLNREEAVRRVNAQLSSDEKRKYADFEIDTSGTSDQTRAKVAEIYQRLKGVAGG